MTLSPLPSIAATWACFVTAGPQSAPVLDMALFMPLFQKHLAWGMSRERVCVLPPASATRRRILGSLHEMAQKPGPEDLFLAYLVLPGWMHQEDPMLAPVDLEPALIADTGVPVSRVGELMASSRARNKLLWLDVQAMPGEEVAARAFVEAALAALPPEVDALILYGASLLEEYPPLAGALQQFLRELPSPGASLKGLLREMARVLTETFPGAAVAWRVTRDASLSPSGPEETPQGRQLSPLDRVFPAAVQRPDDFFNRDQVLWEILNTLRIHARQPIVLQGERGVGKTSLLLRTEHALKEDRWGTWQWLVFYIAPGRLDRWEHFAWELLDGLELALSALGEPPMLEGAHRAYPLTFNRLVQLADRLMEWGLARNPRLGVVVIMDEIDKSGVHPDVLEKTLASIHYLVEKTDLPLFFLMSIIARDLPEPAWGSPLPAKLIRLAPLDALALQEMVEALVYQQGWKLPLAKLQAWIWELSRGHPYLAKLLLVAIREEERSLSPDGALTWQPQVFLQRAVVMEEARQLLEDVYRRFFSDEEKAVVLGLAHRSPQGIDEREMESWPEPYLRAVGRLVERGYVVRRGEGFHLRMGFWPVWLRAWRLWDLERAAHPIPGLDPPPLPSGICVVRSTQRVYVDGREVTLSRYPFRALVYLAEHVGQVVSKDDLVRAIYPDEFHAATDQQIDIIISRVRKALGDKRPYRYLITHRGRGYRLEQATVLEDWHPSSKD